MTDEHVQAHRHEALEPVGHRRHLDAQQLRRQRRLERGGGQQRDIAAPGEHRPIDPEVMVVGAVERIEVDPAGVRHVALVGGDGPVMSGRS